MNRKIHFKMYKSGKSWIYAAVVAGFALLLIPAKPLQAHADSTTSTNVAATALLVTPPTRSQPK